MLTGKHLQSVLMIENSYFELGFKWNVIRPQKKKKEFSYSLNLYYNCYYYYTLQFLPIKNCEYLFFLII